MNPAADPGAARRMYARRAGGYERRFTLRVVRDIQRRAVEQLAPQPGERVLDVACGTGINLPALVERVGPGGSVVGVDLSPDMLDVARERVRACGWDNVELIEAPVDRAPLEGGFDAALLSFTHDVLRTPAALDRVVAALRPGGRVAACGIKWAPRWNMAANAAVWIGTRRYVTTLEGLSEPWSLLAQRLAVTEAERAWLDTMYVFGGRL